MYFNGKLPQRLRFKTPLLSNVLVSCMIYACIPVKCYKMTEPCMYERIHMLLSLYQLDQHLSLNFLSLSGLSNHTVQWTD